MKPICNGVIPAGPDDARSSWLADGARLQRFLLGVCTNASACAEESRLVPLDGLRPDMRSEVSEGYERHRRELRALTRQRAPLEGFRSAGMAFWAAGGRIRGRLDATRRPEEGRPPFDTVLGHVMAALRRDWQAFGDYEVKSLVDVRHGPFRTGRASRYHYWRSYLGAYTLEWAASARGSEVHRLHAAIDRRTKRGHDGLSNLFAEWLDEERLLREATLGRTDPGRVEALGEMATRLVCQELRWRCVEAELEKRALWHAAQREQPEQILVALRLGRIGAYDPDFAGEDRGLVALSVLGRLALLSETGHRALTLRRGGPAVGAAEA